MVVVTHRTHSRQHQFETAATPQLDRQVIIFMCLSDSPTLLLSSLMLQALPDSAGIVE